MDGYLCLVEELNYKVLLVAEDPRFRPSLLRFI